MYNKLFTKILTSSIWLAPDPHRIVWITFLASMDEDGFAQFASVANLAHTARVAPEAAQEAVTAFENPDIDSGDPDHEGRRIERVPGGWIVLNAEKYRKLVSREESKLANRERVARHRAKRHVTPCNADVTLGNVLVMQSEAEAEANTEAETHKRGNGAHAPTPKGKTATRIPEGFELTSERRQVAVTEACDPEREFAKFTDYWRAASGQKARKHDWDATWRNWCRNSISRPGSGIRITRRAKTTAQLEAEEAARGQR